MWCVFGSQSTCVPGRIQVSEATRQLLTQETWEATGGVNVKGKVRWHTGDTPNTNCMDCAWEFDTSRCCTGMHGAL